MFTSMPHGDRIIVLSDGGDGDPGDPESDDDANATPSPSDDGAPIARVGNPIRTEETS